MMRPWHVKEHEGVSPGWGHLEIIAGVDLHILGMVMTLGPYHCKAQSKSYHEPKHS